MLHWPPPTSWAPPPTRGCENANSAFKSEPTNIRSTIKQSLINADYRL